jgi:hypothetical protein
MSTSNDPIPVEQQKAGLMTSPIGAPAGQAGANCLLCYWNGTAYSEGAQICAAGRVLKCVRSGANGYWLDTGRTC